MLLIYTFKKVFKKSHSFDMVVALKRLALKIKYIIPFFLLSTASINNSLTEVEKISFNIINKGTNIGFINVEKLTSDETTTYDVNSNVNTKVILKFHAYGKEKSIYKEDTLIYSSIYRKLNNKVKVNQSLSFDNGQYYLNQSDKREMLNMDIITRNLVTLFFFEPIGINTIYCDKQNKMLNISPLGQGMYKVVFSKNSYNIFHYKNGKCTLIEIEGSFFKVKLIPMSYQVSNKTESWKS